MKKIALVILGLGLLIFLLPEQRINLLSPLLPSTSWRTKPKPLLKYSFENLRSRQYPGSEIKLEKIIKKEASYTSWLFSYQSDGQRITGMANIPVKSYKLPVILMLRGYADDEIYFTGLGTRKAAGVFAENGFITLAPDFLGFGGSDSSSKDILEARFYRPVEVLNLLASIKASSPSTALRTDSNRIGIWAHSNGGQIAISVLEILPASRRIPTVLWAPVSRGFPESILDYLGELDDQGLKVKDAISDFSQNYDVKDYSITNFFNDITAPIQVHQGLADLLIKEEWTAGFVSGLGTAGKNVTYFKYPRNDHNLKQSWDLVVARDVEFFKKNL
mgnify:CR=1 FL=1